MLFLFLLLAWLWCQQAVYGLEINGVSPTRIARGGGTRLEIRGNGFAGDRLQGQNSVFIGPFECSVIDHYTTDSLITCETIPGDLGSYQVSVVVDGQDQASYCCVEYSNGYSPTLTAVVPSAGPPGTEVQLIGAAPWRVRRDCNREEAGPNDESCVGEIIFGDYLCDTGAGTDDASSIIQIDPDLPRYNVWNQYSVRCTLPDPSDQAETMMPGLATAGNVNVSLHFEASLRGGMTVVELDAYKGTRRGDSYLFQLYAVVDSVSPSSGSVAGGTEVTLQGRGFPDLSLSLGDTVDVEVAGSRCTVLSSNFTHLTCATRPQPEGYAPPPDIEGVWPGMRGLEMEIYKDAEYDVSGFSGLSKLNDTITVNNSADGSFRLIETAQWDTPFNLTGTGRWCHKSKAFFIAPTTGYYRFATSVNEYGTLHGSWLLENGTATSRELLISQSSSSPVDDFWVLGDEQWSPSVHLMVDQPILLEGAHCVRDSDRNYGHFQVAVRIPDSAGSAQSLPEIQHLSVSGDRQKREQVISYLSGTGTNDTVLNVTATTSLEYAWMLAQEYPATLTFKPSINGTKLGQDFNVSIIESEQSVRQLLAQALGARTSEIGVLRWANVTTVIYQIGLEAAKFPGFGLDAEIVDRANPEPPFILPPVPLACTTPPPPLSPPPPPTSPSPPPSYPPSYPSTSPSMHRALLANSLNNDDDDDDMGDFKGWDSVGGSFLQAEDFWESQGLREMLHESNSTDTSSLPSAGMAIQVSVEALSVPQLPVLIPNQDPVLLWGLGLRDHFETLQQVPYNATGGMDSSSRTVGWRVQVGNSDFMDAGQFQVEFDPTYTPFFTSSPSSVDSPDTSGTSIELSWNAAAATEFEALPVGALSNASIELQSGPNLYPCTAATILGSSVGRQYSENTTCMLPDYLPASEYTIWLTATGTSYTLGSGFAGDKLTVPLTVSNISHTTSSAAGGLTITLQGYGFSTNASDVAVTFTNRTLSYEGYVLSASETSVSVRTPRVPEALEVSIALDVIVTPTQGAMPQPTNFAVTFDTGLSPRVLSVSPNRGSTAGGTTITVTIDPDNGPQLEGSSSEYSVTVGDVDNGQTCTDVSISSDKTQLTCVTAAPSPRVFVPQVVHVLRQDKGWAECGDISDPEGTPCRYQYIDLWSRRTTWGGNAPPRKGDSVFIPAGNTVLLDVSPPELNAVVLQGHLEFDSSATAELVLRSKFILVNGGSLSVGTAEEPFPGEARITLVGTPTSRQLPLYGNKVLALRNGTVSLHGKHKTPTWTKMARTADVGDQSIEVVGDVSGTWEVDDRIAIASSSVFGVDAEERNVSQIQYNPDRNTTTLFLSTALQYTHLGEVVTVDGDDRGHVLDMRAEVAVLSRNVVFEGDETSASFAHGATIMIHTHGSHPRAVYQGEQIEMRSTGQAFQLGRYSLHWHLHGDAEYKQYMRGCAVSQAWNRAVTIHGTHNVNLTDNVAFRIMGHTFFLEDGIEEGNYITGNLGMLTYPSNALLNTDTTPAVFWITHPNNVVRNNVGSGSVRGYGFWYRFLSHPEGPSFTRSVCPKFTPLLEFKDNVAHSNMFYGLRIHPEFYPELNPCGQNPLNGFDRDYQQVPAVFDGLVAYKNGMKGAIATQVGLIQFKNFTLADNGGGPKQHITNGKDNGANMELTWILDDRNRDEANNTSPVPSMSLDIMAGMTNSILITRTPEGNRGTAGWGWVSSRKITGVIMHSQVEFNEKHSALASLQNVTFVGYDGTDSANGFYALEACGKCKTNQGGAFTFTKGIKFIQADALGGTKKPVALSAWSWPHQGVFLDTDGTLLNSETVQLANNASFPIGVPGTTWQSAVDNNLFKDMPEDCVYSQEHMRGMLCGPHLKFRRLMLNSHQPDQLKFSSIWITNKATNTSSRAHFSKYNDLGYQFVVPTKQDYWIHWDVFNAETNSAVKVDPSKIRIHRPDLLDDSSFVYITTSNVQEQHRYEVNGRSTTVMNYTKIPDPREQDVRHGDAFYNKTYVPDTWWYGDNQYNHTLFTMIALGPENGALQAVPKLCPPGGCTNEPDEVVDEREGILLWSDPDTWSNGDLFPTGKPKAGENVTIPFGWNLVIDEDPAPILLLDVQGNVTVSKTKDITLQATYIMVTRSGWLWAGSEDEPHPAHVTIKLEGTRQTPAYAIREDLNLGSKVLSAFNGGRITMYGKHVSKRWLKLNSTAEAGNNTLVLSDGNHGWSVGDRLLVPSSTFNPRQAEFGVISAVSSDGRTITLEENLQFHHSAMIKGYPGTSRILDARTEIALVTSNIEITAADGNITRGQGGEAFGCHMIVDGDAYASLSHVAFSYGGQMGSSPTITFQNLKPVPQRNNETGEVLTDSSDEPLTMPNPSSIDSSVLLSNMHGALWIQGTGEPVSLTNNLVYEAYDKSAVKVTSTGNTIKGNLVVNVIKEMAGKSGFDDQMVSCFEIAVQPNFLLDNVAAGSERMGFQLWGPSCDTASELFSNNSAHSTLGGMWLEASEQSKGTKCTGIDTFTTYLHWDFGVITVGGITTSLEFRGLVVADSKHKGLLPLVRGRTLHKYEVHVDDSLFIGQSRPEICTMCAESGDPGCAPNLSRQSYNQASPFGASIGLVHGVFALAYMPGPEKKPWDELHGYPTVSGITKVKSTTFAGYKGSSGCGAGSYALGNHIHASDAAHPVYLESSNAVDVVSDGLFGLVGPDPGWRNEEDCGFQVFPPQGLEEDVQIPGVDIDYQLELNCAGPRHAFFMDKDGSLTGVAGSINGAYAAERKFPYDQGTPILKGPCTHSSGFDAYQCYQEDDHAFLHDPRNRPVPQPPGSYFSDPQLFVLESRDADTESRNFGPVHFGLANGTSVDLVVAAMDQGWCFAYTCQERLSSFWTYLPTFHKAVVNFTGSPPKVLRLNYPYIGPDDELVVVLNMKGIPERRFVWLDEQGQEANSYPAGRVLPLSAPPAIGDGNPHGAYFWDLSTTEMWVKMKGGLHLEVRKENAVQVSTTLSVSVSDFYDNLQGKFLQSLAFAMGIPLSRFQIVSVVPGSTVVDARAYDDPDSYGPSKDPSLGSGNMTASLDADDPVVPPTNITVPEKESGFASVLGRFAESIQTGDFEAALGVRVENVGVTVEDDATGGGNEGGDDSLDTIKEIIDRVNEEGNSTALSSTRYSGDVNSLVISILLSLDGSCAEFEAPENQTDFIRTFRRGLAESLHEMNNTIMGKPTNKSEPCYRCISPPSASCTDAGSKRRALLASSVDTSFDVALSDQLTQDEFSSLQSKVDAQADSDPDSLFGLTGTSWEGKVTSSSTETETANPPRGGDPASDPSSDPEPAPNPDIGLEDPDNPPLTGSSTSDDDDTDKLIGGIVGGVGGFLVLIVLPVLVFLYIRKRKQQGSLDSKVRPLDEEEPRPWSFTAHEAPANIPPPPSTAQHEPYSAYPTAPQIGGAIPTPTPAPFGMPGPVNEAQSASSTPSASASYLPTPVEWAQQSLYRGQPQGAANTLPVQQSSWAENHPQAVGAPPMDKAVCSPPLNQTPAVDASPLNQTPAVGASPLKQPQEVGAPRLNQPQAVGTPPLNQPQAVDAPPHYVPHHSKPAQEVSPKTRNDGLRNEPLLMRNSSAGSGSGRQPHNEHVPELSMASIKSDGHDLGFDAAQASMPQVIPARALGYRPVLPPMDREKPKLPTVVPPQLLPLEGHTATALHQQQQQEQQQAGSSVAGQGVRFNPASTQAETEQQSVRPSVGLPGSLADDLRFSKHGRCAEDSNNTIMGGGGN